MLNAVAWTIWLTISTVSTLGVGLYLWRVRSRLSAPRAHRVCVIVPIKGDPEHAEDFERFLSSCLSQQNVEARFIFAVEAEDDPAIAAIKQIRLRSEAVSLVVAGHAEGTGQKVHNLLAALACTTEEDAFVLFADADVELADDGLSQVLRPLLNGRAEIASGYRWSLPADGHLASAACGLMDWGIATAPRSQRWNLCWGGSTALARSALLRLDLPRLWATAVLDDLTLTGAARRRDLPVHAPHFALVPSPTRHDWSSLCAFGRRQYLFVRTYALGHWLVAGGALLTPVLGAALALAAVPRLDPAALAVLLVAAVLQQLRASLRVQIAERVLPGRWARVTKSVTRRWRLALPGLHLLHCAIWIGSALGRTVVWRGVRYELRRA